VIKEFLNFIRIKHWIKNFFVFSPIVFAGRFFDMESFRLSSFAFGGFCFVASSVYVINDLYDIKEDRRHPFKNQNFLRDHLHPNAYYVSISLSLLLLGLLLCLQAGWSVVFVALAYFFMNLIYSAYVKRIIFIDIIFIAIGFQLRIMAGALASGVKLSSWIQLCAFLLALFLGFSKRKRERLLLKDKATQYRATLHYYSDRLLDVLMIVFSALTILSYLFYCLFSSVPQRLSGKIFSFSTVFVVLGITRYFYLTYFRKDHPDFAEILFSDTPLFLIIFLWISYVLALFYLGA